MSYEIDYTQIASHAVRSEERLLIDRLQDELRAAIQRAKLDCSNVTVLRLPGAAKPALPLDPNGDAPIKPANKPADPAFARALYVRPMRIGLRYIGD